MVSAIEATTVSEVAAAVAAIAISMIFTMEVKDDVNRVVVSVLEEGTTTIGVIGNINSAGICRP